MTGECAECARLREEDSRATMEYFRIESKHRLADLRFHRPNPHGEELPEAEEARASAHENLRRHRDAAHPGAEEPEG